MEGTLSENTPRRTYLVTYSQANLEKFPTRESFGKLLENSFNSNGRNSKVLVTQWACCREEHTNGGQHYHASIKLSGPKRWLSVKNQIEDNAGIVVHFSDRHDNYYSAYKYVCKSDQSVLHSKHHPNLKEIGSPQTKNSTKAYRAACAARKRRSAANETANNVNEPDDSASSSAESSGSSNSKKPKRLSNLDVSDFILEHKITSDTQLFAAANSRKQEGQRDLAGYVLSKNPKSLLELINNTWKLKNASDEIERECKSRIEIIKEAVNVQCVDGCNHDWISCALELLRFNKIHPFVYAAALRELISLGRGKFRNILIVGPTNCGKTFMLKPLEKLFKVFANPAHDKYAWVGADKSEVILLQDFRWSSELIQWKDLLLLLEGEIVNLPSPKNHFVSDVCMNTDIPIFATSKCRVEYIGRFNSRDEMETAMMAVRWKVFDFTRQITEEEQKSVPPCPRCFSELVLMGELA